MPFSHLNQCVKVLLVNESMGGGIPQQGLAASPLKRRTYIVDVIPTWSVTGLETRDFRSHWADRGIDRRIRWAVDPAAEPEWDGQSNDERL